MALTFRASMTDGKTKLIMTGLSAFIAAESFFVAAGTVDEMILRAGQAEFVCALISCTLDKGLIITLITVKIVAASASISHRKTLFTVPFTA